MPLEIVTGKRAGEIIDLSEKPVRIGRSPECEVSIPEPSMSRFHAEVSETDGGYQIRDLGSKNGINLDGKSVREAVLQSGQEFKVGKVRFRINDEMTPEDLNSAPVADEVAGHSIEDIEEDGEVGMELPQDQGMELPNESAIEPEVEVIGEDDEDDQKEEIVVDKGKEKLKNLAFAVMIVVGLFLGFMVLKNIGSETLSYKPRTVYIKAGQDLVFSLYEMRVPLGLSSISGIVPQSSDESIVIAEKDHHFDSLNVFRGISDGEVTISFMRGNSVASKLKIVVEDKLVREGLQVKEIVGNRDRGYRLAKARELNNLASSMLNTMPSEARDHYIRALTWADMNPPAAEYTEAFRGKKKATDLMTDTIEKLYFEIKSDYSNHQYPDAVLKLEQIKRYTKNDVYDINFQKAVHISNIIRDVAP